MPPVAAVFTAGWAGGINPYLVVLILAIAGRLGADVPEGLLRTDVLVVAAILTVVEVVVDKVMFLDSVWDVISTALRPAAAAVVTALWVDPSSDLVAVAVGSAGGVVALVVHLSKASIRAAVNTSPEPVSNIALSAVEDVLVASVVVLALLWPWAAAAVAVLLAIVFVLAAVLLGSAARRGFSAIRERLKFLPSGVRHDDGGAPERPASADATDP